MQGVTRTSDTCIACSYHVCFFVNGNKRDICRLQLLTEIKMYYFCMLFFYNSHHVLGYFEIWFMELNASQKNIFIKNAPEDRTNIIKNTFSLANIVRKHCLANNMIKNAAEDIANIKKTFNSVCWDSINMPVFWCTIWDAVWNTCVLNLVPVIAIKFCSIRTNNQVYWDCKSTVNCLDWNRNRL